MFGIGPLELVVVLVVALLVMGPQKLPELARGLGKALAEFRRASNDLRRSINFDLEEHKIEPPPGPAQTGSPQQTPKPGSPLDKLDKLSAQQDLAEKANAESESALPEAAEPEVAPSDTTPSGTAPDKRSTESSVD